MASRDTIISGLQRANKRPDPIQMTKQVVDGYEEGCMELSDAEFSESVTQCIRHLRKFPTVADILTYVPSPEPERPEALTWTKVQAMPAWVRQELDEMYRANADRARTLRARSAFKNDGNSYRDELNKRGEAKSPEWDKLGPPDGLSEIDWIAEQDRRRLHQVEELYRHTKEWTDGA